MTHKEILLKHVPSRFGGASSQRASSVRCSFMAAEMATFTEKLAYFSNCSMAHNFILHRMATYDLQMFLSWEKKQRRSEAQVFSSPFRQIPRRAKPAWGLKRTRVKLGYPIDITESLM